MMSLDGPHLSGIQVPEKINAEVELLIGQDVPEALEPSGKLPWLWTVRYLFVLDLEWTSG